MSAYASLPSLGALTVALTYAELTRLMERPERPRLFGDEVRWVGAGRRETNNEQRKVAV